MEQVHHKADLIVAKQRHGPTGSIPLFFEGELHAIRRPRHRSFRSWRSDTAHARLTIDLGAIVANWRYVASKTSLRRGRQSRRLWPRRGSGRGGTARRPAAAISSSPRPTRRWPCATPSRTPRWSCWADCSPAREADYAAHGIIPALGSLAEIDAWSGLARRLGRALPAFLHFDTGMSRLGLDARECAILAEDHARLAGIDVRAVMSHLVSAESPGRSAERGATRSLRRVARAAAARAPPASRIPPGFSSAGLRLRPRAARFGAVRRQSHAEAGKTPMRSVVSLSRARPGGARHPGRRDGRLRRAPGRAARPAGSPRSASATPMAGIARIPTPARLSLTATPFRW